MSSGRKLVASELSFGIKDLPNVIYFCYMNSVAPFIMSDTRLHLSYNGAIMLVLTAE